jgi:oligosaccharyltransferase complex subunit delta (ribophorin II)
MVYVFSDDGTFYFDEKNVDATEYKGPITTSASVVRGFTSFANVVSGKLNVSFPHFSFVLVH